MRSAKMFLAFAPLLLLATGLRAAPPPAPPESPIPNGIGVNIHFTDPKPSELDQLYAAGFRWVRMDFGWGGTEGKKGEYDFSAYDRLIAALDAHHIKAYFILDYSNRNYDNDLSPHTDEGRSAFAKWAAASVRHFKGHGILWEMYNEPNIFFWRPQPNVDDYAKLAIAVGKAIREAEPGEIYIGPATSTIDLPFLEACFKAGCLEYWSAVSVHPYRQTDPETVAEEYRKLRQLIARYAPKGRQIPILSGEWGYSSAWKDFDEDRQGKYLQRELLTNIANDIPISIWYDWHEDGTNPREPEHHFGTVRFKYEERATPVYEPKPAYRAAEQLALQLKDFRFSKRLWVGDSHSYMLLFDKDGAEQRLVSWSSSGMSANAHYSFPIDAAGVDLRGHRSDVPFHPVRLVGSPIPAWYEPCYAVPRNPSDLLRIAAAWSRVPLDVAVNGPGIARVETTVGNPLDHPITVIAHGQKTQLKPGETSPLIAAQSVSRSENASPIDSVLEVEGLGKITQRTEVAIINPLHAFFFPRTGKTQTVLVENPSGEAFEANAYLNGGNGTPFEHLVFKPGQMRKSVTFTLPAGRADDGRAGLMLVGVQNRLELDVPAARYVPLQAVAKENAASWRVIADGDAKVPSEQTLSDGTPPDGTPAPGLPCLKLDYRFEKGWKFVRVVPKSEMKIAELPRSIGIWIFGDGQGNLARMRFTDATGQTFQPDAGAITWTGWRYVEFPLAGHDIAHWGGKNDGIVHDSIRIDTLFLLDSAHRKDGRGEIYLSTPMAVYEK